MPATVVKIVRSMSRKSPTRQAIGCERRHL